MCSLSNADFLQLPVTYPVFLHPACCGRIVRPPAREGFPEPGARLSLHCWCDIRGSLRETEHSAASQRTVVLAGQLGGRVTDEPGDPRELGEDVDGGVAQGVDMLRESGGECQRSVEGGSDMLRILRGRGLFRGVRSAFILPKGELEHKRCCCCFRGGARLCNCVCRPFAFSPYPQTPCRTEIGQLDKILTTSKEYKLGGSFEFLPYDTPTQLGR